MPSLRNRLTPKTRPRFDYRDDPDWLEVCREFDAEEREREALERTSPAMKCIDLDRVPHRRPPFPTDRSYIVGQAVVFGVVSEPHNPAIRKTGKPYRLRFAPGCFRRALECEFNVYACLRHDRSDPIARVSDGTLELSEDDRGLWVKIAPYLTPQGRLTEINVLDGTCRGMSIGFDPDETACVWSFHKGDRLCTVTDCGLVEVTIAADPVFPQTSCKLVGPQTGGRQ